MGKPRSRWPYVAGTVVVVAVLCAGLGGWRGGGNGVGADQGYGTGTGSWSAGLAPTQHAAGPLVAEAQTTLRLVDAAGAPVAGLPIYAAEASQGMGGPEPLGLSDFDGRFIPEQLPIEVDLGEWPALPTSLLLVDDHREHVMTVVPACDVVYTWEPPPAPAPLAIMFHPGWGVDVADGKAEFRLPCVEKRVTLHNEPGSVGGAVALARDHFGPEETSIHLEWTPRDAVEVCVVDEAGRPIPEARLEMGPWGDDAWQLGACWAMEPNGGCQTVSAAGYLRSRICPEEGGTWLLPRYEVVLEQGVTAHYACQNDDGTLGCTSGEVKAASCLSRKTPDIGSCDASTQTCSCPEADDAYVVCTQGDYQGEDAAVSSGEAVFAYTGTASLTIPGATFCGGRLTRHDQDAKGNAGVMACEGGNAVRRGLRGGTYSVRRGLHVYAWIAVGNIMLKDGEQKVFPIDPPQGHRLDVQFAGGDPAEPMAWTQGGSLEQEYIPLAELVVPPGAQVWVHVAGGWCHYVDPPARVACEPDGTISQPERMF
ncbi:hypothetical protein LBMAG42_05890 [Deltaproteobacteria bacterium]|nr:hypothetical protein LBMAG42_05890 [Deltaproteobacteria bacterium]